MDFKDAVERLMVLMDLPPNRLCFQCMMEENPDIAKYIQSAFIEGSNVYKNLLDVHKDVITLKNQIMDSMIVQFPDSSAGFMIGGQCCSHLPDGPKKNAVGDAITVRFSTRKQEASTILNLMHIINVSDKSMITPNSARGTNKGFVAQTSDGRKLFVKNFVDEQSGCKGKLDPNELLVYKVLENLGLGPVTEFLIRAYSFGHGATCVGNYIATEDVCCGETFSFFMDELQNDEYFRVALSTDCQANVELSALSAANDIMLLGDTFGQNPGNYGLLVRNDDVMGERTVAKYGFVAVDHLPRSNNTKFPPHRFAPHEPYSPRVSVQKKVDSTRHLGSQKHGVALRGQLIEIGRREFPTAIIRELVLARLLNMKDAVDAAQLVVLELIDQHERSFTEGARERLQSYVATIKENADTFFSIY